MGQLNMVDPGFGTGPGKSQWRSLGEEPTQRRGMAQIVHRNRTAVKRKRGTVFWHEPRRQL